MKGKLFQLQAALACSFGKTLSGIITTWPSYTSSILSSNETTPLSKPMTTAEESLLGSLPSLGAMLGTAICGIIIDKLGRRNGGVILALPYLLSWVTISMTTSTMVVLAARFFSGVATGGILVYAPIFISEVAEDSFRGTLASGPLLLYCTGTLLSYIFGWTLSYRVIIWVNVAFSAILILFLFSVKESPVFLLKQNREMEACAAIAHYRGVTPFSTVVLKELEKLKQQFIPPAILVSNTAEMYTDVENVDLNADAGEIENLNREIQIFETGGKKTISQFKLLFMLPTSRRAFFVVTTVMTLQVFMGIVPVQVYAKKVFAQADPSKADLYTIMFALVLTCGCLVPTAIADKVGRRILIITASILVCLCLLSIGFLLQSRIAPPWVTVLTIFLYCFLFKTGAGTVPYILMAEVFTSDVQNLASMIIMEWVWFLNFVIIAIFPFMNKLLGIHGTFYCFAFMAITNAVISFFFVPETKGLSKVQIQQLFVKNK